MDFSFINTITGLKNMESRIETDSKIWELKTCCYFLIIWNIPFNDTILSYFIKMKDSTFFEYEIDISYISIYSESKNMEDSN